MEFLKVALILNGSPQYICSLALLTSLVQCTSRKLNLYLRVYIEYSEKPSSQKTEGIVKLDYMQILNVYH